MNIMFIMKITYPWHFAIVPYLLYIHLLPSKFSIVEKDLNTNKHRPVTWHYKLQYM